MFDLYDDSALDKTLDKLKEKLTPHIPEGWVLVGEVNGKPRYKYVKGDNFRVVKEKNADTPYKHVRLAPTDISMLRPGCTCPKCNGTGRYKWHDDHSRVEACFWCTDTPTETVGKGFLNEKNIRYIKKHIRQDTAYWIHSA